ncbi:MAG: sulfite exporter TauE/SafE family protein [Acidimicrobiales bacterium]
MSALADLAITGAGVVAGAVNTVVGSGTLLTFPTLLGLGYSPLVANVSNSLGLVPGSVGGAIGYRAELAGQGRRAVSLGVGAAAGGIAGGTLLLTHPSTFQAIVPWLILGAVALMAAQPRLKRALAEHDQRGGGSEGGAGSSGTPRWWLRLGVVLTGVYGGYFGAAQGVILIAILSLGPEPSLQRVNALKNVLAGLINAVAAILFIAFGPVAWLPAGLLAVGSAAGSVIGARYGRRLSPGVLRALIIVVGTGVAIKLLAT